MSAEREDLPLKHEVWQHFKGTQYRIVDLAKHSETGEDLVVYRECTLRNVPTWVRPLSMFLDQHPSGPQRFTRVTPATTEELRIQYPATIRKRSTT